MAAAECQSAPYNCPSIAHNLGVCQPRAHVSPLRCATLRCVKLGELINNRRRDLGISYDKLVDKAQARGFTLTKTSLAAYASQPVIEAPKRRTMEAIAYALDVSYAEVVLAVAEDLIGTPPVEVSTLQHVNSWLTITGGRSDEQIASVLRIVRTVTAALDAAYEGDEPEGAHQRNGNAPTLSGGGPSAG